jgi:Dyp-type peroxidase family
MHVEAADIQGIIITAYPHLTVSRYFFLHINEPAGARQWLGDLAPRITTADWKRRAAGEIVKPKSATNIAFTNQGLLALQLDPNVVSTFSEEFRQGMSEPARARRLGDNGASDPSQWELGNPGTPPEREIHILLILEAPNAAELHLLTQQYRQEIRINGGLSEIHATEDGTPLPLQKEHFGFHDGISQPEIEGSPKRSRDAATCVKAGEFILGYKNEYNLLPSTPTVSAEADVHNNLRPLLQDDPSTPIVKLKDLGRNGSYLVFRKLYQDVAAFRKYIAANAGGDDALLGAKLVGRWASGTSLILSPAQDKPPENQKEPENNFVYAATDPYGYVCPLGAHVRRVNPRDAMSDREPTESMVDVRRHRILRRGVPYGETLATGLNDDGKPRGLLFICINADIERQFEFIQQTWSNNPKFHGMNNDRDPLIGDNLEPGDAIDELQPRVFTIQKDGTRCRLMSIPRFVTMKGGAYFFLPSISAIFFLAGKARAATSVPDRGDEPVIARDVVMELA